MQSANIFQILGDFPALAEIFRFVIEDEIEVNSIVYFEKAGNETTAVKLVDLENLDAVASPIYRAGRGSELGQRIARPRGV